MTITQVLYVMEVSRHGSISRAAEALYISQPALSAQIKALEMELGCMLFHRTTHGISPTAAGKAFCKSAAPVAKAWEMLQQDTDELKSTICRQIRIGFDVRALSNDLFDPVAEFFDQHPETSVSFITDMSQNVLEGLEEKRMDLAIGRLPPDGMINHKNRFHISPLLVERQCILMAPDDPRSCRTELSFQELQNSIIVSGPEGSIDDFEMKEICRTYGIQPTRIFRSDDINTVMSLVRNGRGVAFGPASFARHFGVASVPMLPVTEIDLNLICRKEDRRHSLVRNLENHLKKYV